MITTVVETFLANITPFKGLPKHELETLGSQSLLKKYQKGEYIYSEGDEANFVWVLLQGRVNIHKFSSTGKSRTIETINPGELFGTLCRLGSNNRTYPCTATSAENSAVIQISEKNFLRLFHQYPSMVTGVCSLCSTRLNQMQNLSCVSQEPADKRIAKVLIELNDKTGPPISITKREIAEMAGTTVETTIRTMSVFKKKNWITSSRGKVTLQSEENLKTLIQNNN
jgi:CRP-like cAMP-binding protein